MEEYIGSEMYRLIIVRILRNDGNIWYECVLNPIHCVSTMSWDGMKEEIDHYWDNFVTFTRKEINNET